MAKATKKQAREVYDDFYLTLRHLNGGTREENERQAKECYNSMKVHADAAAAIVANPNKRLSEDTWMMDSLRGIPGRLESFRVRYGL